MSYGKTLSIATLLAAVGAASAGAMDAPGMGHHHKGGFYVGGSLGANTLDDKVDSVTSGPEGEKANMTKTRVTGGVLAGYAHNFGDIHTSLEIDYLFSTNKLQALGTRGAGGVPNNRYNLKTRNVFGGALRLGYHVAHHVLVYGRAGFESRKTDFSLITQGGTTPQDDIHKKTTSTAFVPGCGLEVPVSERIALRGEYRIALNHKKSYKRGRTSVTHRPKTNYYLFSATYRLTDN